jgi:uncharacterized membrane protein
MVISRSSALLFGLIVSVAINLFLVGAISGRVINRSAIEVLPPPSVSWIMRELEPEARRTLQPQMQEYGESLRPLRGDMFRAQREVNRLMAQDPLDRDAIRTAFRELRQANIIYQEMSHEQVAAVFSQLTAEQRQRALRFMSERRNPSNAMETMRQGGQRLDRNGLRRDSAEQGDQ